MYDTDRHIAIDSIYGCDIYANALEKLSLKKTVQRYDIQFVWFINKIPFLMMWNTNKDIKKSFWTW